MSPKVSILMAVYNAERYLRQALDSVLGQTLTSWELLCVDDHSTDTSRSILWEYAKRDSRVKVFCRDCNAGQAVCRNEALTKSQGEFITMLDADDWLSPDCLEQALRVLDEQTDCAVLRLMQCYDDGTRTLYATPFTSSSLHGDEYDYPIISGEEAFRASLDWQLHGLYVVRASIHKQYPYDASCRLFSDDNTTHLHYLHSRQVRFCSGTYFYRKHSESCTNAFSANRFLLMQANLSLHNTLLAERVSPDIIAYYEKHRWLNYIGQWWLYSQQKSMLTPSERTAIKARFRAIYQSFSASPVSPKFGYTHFSSYTLFRIQECLYFSIRKLKEKF